MKILFAAASAAALLAGPALAQTTVPSGYVGAAYSRSEIDTPIGEAEGDGFSIEGAAAIPLGQGPLALQLNGGYNSGEDVDGLDGTAHLFTRNDQFAIGGFAGVMDVEDTTAWVFGGEGQVYLPNVTLAAGAGWGQIDDVDADLWGVSGEARFFASDNLRFDAGVGWLNVDTGFGDADAMTFGVGGEFQPTAAPFSVFTSWSHLELDDIDISGDSLSVGARFTFGQSLRARDRAGPSFGRLGGFGAALSAL